MAAGIPWIKTLFLTVAGWLGDNYAEKAEYYTKEAMFATARGITVGYVLNLLILIVVRSDESCLVYTKKCRVELWRRGAYSAGTHS